MVHVLSFGSSHIVRTENGVGCQGWKRPPSISPASPLWPSSLLISFLSSSHHHFHFIPFLLFVLYILGVLFLLIRKFPNKHIATFWCLFLITNMQQEAFFSLTIENGDVFRFREMLHIGIKQSKMKWNCIRLYCRGVLYTYSNNNKKKFWVLPCVFYAL